MPLLRRARVEIYLPEDKAAYEPLRQAFETEFLQTFGGCTVIREINGLYLGSDNQPDRDNITLLYADTPFDIDKNFEAIAMYADELRKTALEATSEESVLVVVHEIYHSL